MQTRIHRGEKVLGEFDLEPGDYIVGSAETAHLRLDDPSVAPEHARLKIGTSGIEVQDLGSGRGTLLGRLAVDGVVAVPEGARISIGDLTVEVGYVEASSPGEEQPPFADSRYVFGEVIAQGAMGTIRRARELTTGREVAMKQMHERLASGDPALASRFAQEARITAHLEHPNVVPVHDVSPGTGHDRFYTMKMVRGMSLEELIGQLKENVPDTATKYSLEALLTIFQKVCDALAFAHSKGIIHRDLKPANIMVGEFGEVLVMDWGVAKVLAEKEIAFRVMESTSGYAHDSVSTMAGTVMGTPFYMAPEQANGDIESVDERSDLYSLGAILYELLTLARPVVGRNTAEVLHQVRTGGIVPISARQADKALPHLPDGRVPISLAAVTMKALSLSPERRYQHVVDLQADIRAYQAGHATDAEGASAWRQFTLLIRRHKGIAGSMAAGLLLLEQFK